MESESSLGNSLCIFTTDSLSELSQAVEEQGISLGDFLTGLYENRTDSSAQAPVRLADLYRSCHTDTALPQIPGITVKDRVLMIEKNSTGRHKCLQKTVILYMKQKLVVYPL